jgi:hypothetical protein
MLMITSGSPKEPENEQQDAGQSQSSRIWDWNPKQSFAAIGSPVLMGALRDIRATASRGPMSQAVVAGQTIGGPKVSLGVLRTSEGSCSQGATPGVGSHTSSALFISALSRDAVLPAR